MSRVLQSKKENQKSYTGNIIRQSIITIILLILTISISSYCIGLVVESTPYEEYRWLLSDLNDGDYARCAESYLIKEHLGERMGEEFLQFDEFELFYRDYVLCLEYKLAKEPEKHQDKLKESIANMEQIYENTIYSENIPHYEYLLECINNMQ